MPSGLIESFSIEADLDRNAMAYRASPRRRGEAGKDLVVANCEAADAAVIHFGEGEAVAEKVEDGAAFNDAAEGDFVDSPFVVA